MRLDIVQKNYEMTDKVRGLIDRKVSKLDKYFDEDTAVKLVLKKENEVCKMEITAAVGGMFVRSEGSGKNMYDIIDEVLPKLERQINRHKSKLRAKLKSTAFKAPMLFAGEAPEEDAGIVEKVKSFEVQPMAVEEAAFELDMIGHDFYIFADEATRELRVIYRRDNGNYGLLKPMVK